MLEIFLEKEGLVEIPASNAVWRNLSSILGAEESKRDFLDRLFVELPKTDRGRSGLLRTSTFLMDQQSFPDLQVFRDGRI